MNAASGWGDDASPASAPCSPCPPSTTPDLLGRPGRRGPARPGRSAAEVAVVEIDPELADTAAMSEAYDLPITASANCVVVAGRRDGEERVAACVVRADTRADVNNLVKRTLDVRKASFLAMDRAVEESGMEYGGITPARPARRTGGCWSTPGSLDIDVAVIGSGVRRSKLLLPGPAARRAPGRRGRRGPRRLNGSERARRGTRLSA